MKTIERNEIETLVPHRGKMFLLDKITEYDTTAWTVSSETKISEDFMFFDKDLCGVPNYAVFEIAAQTISALTGLYAKENNLPVNMGFILTVSNFHFNSDMISAGATVTAKAIREAEAGNVYSFSTELYTDGTLLGSGKLTVMEVTDQ